MPRGGIPLLTPASGRSRSLNTSLKAKLVELPMGPIHLFDLASQQARWLSARQIAVAENIGNANTPGYKAKDVPPFEATHSTF
jgi:Flagella basal body rod protein